MRLGFQEPAGELNTASRIIPIAERIGIELGFQEPAGELNTASRTKRSNLTNEESNYPDSGAYRDILK